MNVKLLYYRNRCIEVLCAPLGLLPKKKNRIICISHKQGMQYSDSPMYITEYLLKKNKKAEIIWIFSEPEKFAFLKEKGIKTVKYGTLKEAYYLNTSRVCITNLFRFPPYLAAGRDQMRMNTMHGGGAYKSLLSVMTDAESVSKYDYLTVHHKINRCNLCLSGSKATTEKVYRGELDYKGKILEAGLPRNDSIVHPDPEAAARVKERYDIREKTVLIMPTWRKDNSRDSINLDYRKLTETLAQRYGGKWKALLRLHHNADIDVSDIMTEYKDVVINVTDYDNPQDLISAADLLITDYSSVIWDFALKKGPVILFAPDISEYRKERGFVIPPDEWKLNIATDSEGVIDIIRTHSMEELCRASQDHLDAYGSCETGKATEVVCRYIMKYCGLT